MHNIGLCILGSSSFSIGLLRAAWGVLVIPVLAIVIIVYISKRQHSSSTSFSFLKLVDRTRHLPHLCERMSTGKSRKDPKVHQPAIYCMYTQLKLTINLLPI